MTDTRSSTTEDGPKPVTPKQPAAWRTGSALWIIVIVVAVVALVATYILFVEPPPPRHLRMAAGSPGGTYFAVATRYAEEVRAKGVTIDVVPTEGSGENLRLLEDDTSGVSVALVQSGLASDSDRQALVSLGSLYREPLWIFFRGAEDVGQLGKLAGKRIAVGPERSGTRHATVELFAASGVGTPESPGIAGSATFVDLAGDEAAAALVRGDVDAVAFVASVETPIVRTLLATDGIRLVSFEQQEALTRRYRYLSPVTLPRGIVDLGRDIPPADVRLVAPAATLVVRKGFHPALVSLLLQAAKRVNGPGDMLSAYGEFPTSAYTDLPLSEDATRFFEYGPSVLERHLPFWLASLVERAKILLIPIVVLFMPLARVAPPLVVWTTRRKIYRWYRAVREIDRRIATGLAPAAAREELARLAEIEAQVQEQVDVPLGYMQEFFDLRQHMDYVRRKVEALADPPPDDGRA